jgi:peroxiredoxin
MRREVFATAVALVFGVPLAFLMAAASADGETRRREAPIRGMIGNEAFEALVRGERTPQHYYGRSRRAPDFELRDREGRPWRLSARRGKKTVVMNFWTLTCAPCLEEMPSLDRLARALRRYDDVELVTISTDPGWSAVAPVLPPNFAATVLFDPDRSVVRGKFGTRLYPETWIVDKEGLVRLRVDGARDWSSPLALDLIEVFR